MAKKSFKETMEEVAQNSRDMNKKYPPPQIVTGPKTGSSAKLKTDRSVPTRHKFEDEQSATDIVNFATRPGRFRGPNSGKDVNLPLELPRRRRIPGMAGIK